MQPDAAVVLDLIEAFRRSRTMFAAVSLGIFDRLEEGPQPLWRIRREGEDAGALERLLDACVSLDLLVKNGEDYANTEAAGTYLRERSPRTLTGYIHYSNDVLWRLWAHLEDAVREGSHRWTQTFGSSGGLFSHFYGTEESKREFLRGLHGLGLLSSPAVAAAFDLTRFRRMVDLGGATGHLAMAAAERFPSMQTAVLDLPQVVEFAREFLAGTRVELIAGDFFADPLPPADLYAASQVLHDWGEEKIRALLDKVYQALRGGGGFLIAERLLEDDLSGPVHAHMQSLNMLVCTEGRERSFAGYAELLQQAGFTQVEGKITGASRDAVLAIK